VPFVIEDVDILFIVFVILEAQMEPAEVGISDILLRQSVNALEPLERQVFLFWVEVQDYDDSVFYAWKEDTVLDNIVQDNYVLVYEMQVNLAWGNVIVKVTNLFGGKFLKKNTFHFILPLVNRFFLS
jgi:hypothetical protein